MTKLIFRKFFLFKNLIPRETTHLTKQTKKDGYKKSYYFSLIINFRIKCLKNSVS